MKLCVNHIKCYLCGEPAIVEIDRIFREEQWYHNTCWEITVANRENPEEKGLININRQNYLEKVSSNFWDQGPLVAAIIITVLILGPITLPKLMSVWFLYLMIKSVFDKDKD